MPRLRLLALVGLALSSVAGVGFVARAQEPELPATQRVLLPAPDPAGPVVRGTFVDDPLGQIERIAAGDHLVAWSVRTPADPLRTKNEDIRGPFPMTMPTQSEVVVADERGGPPLVIDVGARLVQVLTSLHGPGGEPQLAFRHCTTRDISNCTDELLTLSGDAPAAVTGRAAGQAATRALGGRVDGGRRLIVGKRKRGRCVPPLSVAALDGSGRRTLRALRYSTRRLMPKCEGLSSVQLFGHFASVQVWGSDPEYDLTATEAFTLDLDGGATARWRDLGRSSNTSAGSGGDESLGPVYSDGALFWSALDTESFDSVVTSLVRRPLTGSSSDITAGPPVAAESKNVCAIAATTGAVYQLDNDRCTPYVGFGKVIPGAIHRVSGAAFGLAPPKPVKPSKG